MKRAILLVLVVVLLAAGCSAQAASSTSSQPGTVVNVGSGSYRDVTPTELQAMLKNKDFKLINVHIPFEGNLPSTDLSIPYDQITQHLDQIPNKDARLVLYCRSGRMSQIAAADLARLGYTNVYELVGGMVAWEEAGLTIEH